MMGGSPMMAGSPMPQYQGMYHYPLGEPYGLRPGMDPRRASHGSYHSAPSTGRRSYDDDWSGMDSDEDDEEGRRRRKRERQERRRLREQKTVRPTMADSMFALWGGLKNAMGERKNS